MKYKTLIKIFFAIVISLVSGNISQAKNKEFPYLKNGISFSLAEGWRVTANDSIGNNAWYFSAESKSPKSTGLITLTWINKVENPDETIALHQKTMKSSNIFRNPGIEFTSVSDDSFAGFKVKSCRYVTIVNQQKLEGVIYCFNSQQKTITIFFQSGLRDCKINQKALDLIKITFNSRD
jgi:hypothetical protein